MDGKTVLPAIGGDDTQVARVSAIRIGHAEEVAWTTGGHNVHRHTLRAEAAKWKIVIIYLEMPGECIGLTRVRPGGELAYGGTYLV